MNSLIKGMPASFNASKPAAIANEVVTSNAALTSLFTPNSSLISNSPACPANLITSSSDFGE